MIGGTSAEKNLLTVKLASTHYYDSLPTTGDETGRAFRDIELEKQLLQEAYKIGLGAQFGGKYMAHDVSGVCAAQAIGLRRRSLWVFRKARQLAGTADAAHGRVKRRF